MPFAILPSQHGGVEGLAVEEEAGREIGRPAGLDEVEVTALVGSVELVPDDGMPGMGGMHADLVHASGERVAADQGESHAGLLFKPAHHLETGEGFLAVGMHDLFDPHGRFDHVAFAQERSVDEELFAVRPPMHDGEVGFAELPAFHRLAQHAGGGLVFRDEDDPARLAVEPVDQGKMAAAGALVGAEGLETIEQGRRIPRHGGVHHQVRRFVHDEVVLGLIEDGEIGAVEAQVDDFTILPAAWLCPRISRAVGPRP